jgi:hypothetical protein
MSSLAARTASHQAPKQHHRTAYCAVRVQGLHTIFRTGRLEAARRRSTSTDLALVDADRRDETPCCTRPRLSRTLLSAERCDQGGRGEQREDKAVAVQALADATARFEQAGIPKAGSSWCRLVVAARTLPAARRRLVGVVRIVGVVAVVISSSAPSHRWGWPFVARPNPGAAVRMDTNPQPAGPPAVVEDIESSPASPAEVTRCRRTGARRRSSSRWSSASCAMRFRRLADRGLVRIVVALDGEEQLVLGVGQAHSTGLLVAPAVEPAQGRPERQQVGVVAVRGGGHDRTLSAAPLHRNAMRTCRRQNWTAGVILRRAACRSWATSPVIRSASLASRACRLCSGIAA